MTLSPKGLQLLLDYEVGGGEAYYRKFLSRPTWPGVQSGVTIGIGWDCGYNSPAQFDEAWKNVLADDNAALLRAALGIKALAARDFLRANPDLRDIEIPWEKALDVFQRITLPRFYMATLRTYPQAIMLPPEARDALISLIFNRGTDLAGQRRAEMLEIQTALRQGRNRDVPDLIRSMRRLWPDTNSLQRRRDAEAELFEKALEPKRKR